VTSTPFFTCTTLLKIIFYIFIQNSNFTQFIFWPAEVQTFFNSMMCHAWKMQLKKFLHQMILSLYFHSDWISLFFVKRTLNRLLDLHRNVPKNLAYRRQRQKFLNTHKCRGWLVSRTKDFVKFSFIYTSGSSSWFWWNWDDKEIYKLVARQRVNT
jgi:hypothetical protein